MYCINCGKQGMASDVYCWECGKPMNGEMLTAVPASGPTAVASGTAAPFQSAPATRTNGFAIAALVLGILGIWLLAIIFGAVGLSQTKRDASYTGRGLAIAGLVLGIVVGVLWVAFFAWIFYAAFSHNSVPFFSGSQV